MTPEARARLSAAQRARGHDAGRARQAEAMRQRWADPEFAARMRAQLRRTGARPAALTESQAATFARMAKAGATVEAIARACGCSPRLVLRHAFNLIQGVLAR